MLRRRSHLSKVRSLLRDFPAVAILGARQVGKTTLARQLAGNKAAWFDLEDPDVLDRLARPTEALRPLRGLVVLDEIQRRPELFPVLRVLCDRPGVPARFVVLGSASPQLLRQSSESLAGRVAYHTLDPFCLEEVGPSRLERLWLRGGFPRSFLARDGAQSFAWRRELISTYLQRDLPQLGIGIPAETLGRFWRMLTHYHGQVFNSSAFARSFGVGDTTVRRYLDVLAETFMVRLLPPWQENISKRQVKAPKAYFRDSGLLHALQGLPDRDQIFNHPHLGASWEGFALEEVVRRLQARAEECFFWATYQGAELDLLVARGRERLGFEFKHHPSPGLTPSMEIACRDLKLDRLTVIHRGTETYRLAPRVVAVPLSGFGGALK